MKLKTSLLYLFISLFILPPKIFAIECVLPLPSSQDELKIFEDACRKKYEESVNQGNTLKAVISALDAKIRITQAQIRQTTTQIVSLEKDVATLSTVLVDLDKTLVELTQIYLARVRESYFRRGRDTLVLFL